MRAPVIASGLCVLVTYATPVSAEPHCMARALADVPAKEAPEELRSKRNGSFGPVTQIKVDRKSGRMYFCGRNTYCYDSNAFELNTPCRVKLDKGYTLGNDFVYFTR